MGFFVQSILAGRYIHRRELRLVSLESFSSVEYGINIAGRLPENSRNRFVDRQSKKNSKRDRPKKLVFSLKADLLCFD